MIIDEDDYLAHYGILRRSGRYPWGSGKDGRDPYDDKYKGILSSSTNVRNKTFLQYVDDMRAAGMSETEIARGMGVSTTQLRAAKTNAINQQRQAKISQIEKLKEKGLSTTAIGRKIGMPEPTVRSYLIPSAKERVDVLTATKSMLKEELAQKRYLDVGKGQENWLNVNKTKLGAAVASLQDEGYPLYYLKTRQLGTGKDTSVKVLCLPGVTYSELSANRDQLGQIAKYSVDDGKSYLGLLPPIAVNPKRVAVRYAEDGGDKADGVIYVRRGVKDLSLGDSRYAQVRIQVGPDHFIKGMAMYKDDMPDGVDLVFNTNKSDTGKKMDALKPLLRDPRDPTKVDQANPFGAIVKQLGDIDPATGKVTKVRSAMNIVNEEGQWGEWSKSLASQMLSKQSPKLAREQLAETRASRQKEFDEIMALTNPTVRRKLLEKFADSTDAAAVHLKAAHMPRQASHVILPIDSLPDTQVYAPKYFDGEQVVLIRYPHGGLFEIPTLTVNNKHKEARALLGDARDAIGINSRVAERMSGADFDGDTVLVIPNNGNRVQTQAALEGLRNFNPKKEYAAYDGMPRISEANMQSQMGQVSNLITDMTLQKAPANEVVRAIRHSMVVIDSYKHSLDYKRSAQENGIAALRQKYQVDLGGTGGASTLISRATSTEYIPERRARRASEGGPIDPKTGAKVYVPTGRSYVNKKGKTVENLQGIEKLALATDANTLSSGTPMERQYAEHSNALKKMANDARLAQLNTPRAPYSRSAAITYKKEVDRLNAALNLALRNAPLERQAQILANARVQAQLAAAPDTDAKQRKRLESQALETARTRTGAKKQRIEISQEEWNAIQAGALHDTKVRAILDNADMDIVVKLATPRPSRLMSNADTKRAQRMLDSGISRAEVAKALGVSVSTLDEVTSVMT
jgi:hypothetical protein